MCIAIYSPIGVDIPCEDNLKNSWEHNPHGAGFAYNERGHVQIEKGFMTWDAFKKALEKANRNNALKNKGVLIHFRIQTHGGVNPECCHPFPIIADEAALKKRSIKTNYAVIHNGIISLTSSEAYRREKMSDTMVFIEKYLTKIATNKKWFNNRPNFELIGDLIDSKMAILNGDGVIHSTSGFTKDADGNWYSNSTYKEPRVKYTAYNYDYDYGYNKGYYGGYRYGKYDEDYNEKNHWGKSSSSSLYNTISALSPVNINKGSEDEEQEEMDELYEPLMMLDKSMYAVDYGFTMESDEECYEADSALPIFIDCDGYLYQASSEDVDGNGVVKNLDCIGWGEFYYINPDSIDDDIVDFVPTHKCKIDEVH